MDIPKYNSLKYRRKSTRLKDYDYSQHGCYFVTVTVKNPDCVFGKIVNAKAVLNNAGKVVQRCWLDIPNYFSNSQLDEFIIMPNHVHGIIIIMHKNDTRVHEGVQDVEPLRINSQSIGHPGKNKYQKIIPGSIGSIIRGFKIGVTKWYRRNTDIHTVWQRNFYEHIIRNEDDLNRIREYIINNPLKWKLDNENPSTFDV